MKSGIIPGYWVVSPTKPVCPGAGGNQLQIHEDGGAGEQPDGSFVGGGLAGAELRGYRGLCQGTGVGAMATKVKC